MCGERERERQRDGEREREHRNVCWHRVSRFSDPLRDLWSLKQSTLCFQPRLPNFHTCNTLKCMNYPVLQQASLDWTLLNKHIKESIWVDLFSPHFLVNKQTPLFHSSLRFSPVHLIRITRALLINCIARPRGTFNIAKKALLVMSTSSQCLRGPKSTCETPVRLPSTEVRMVFCSKDFSNYQMAPSEW